MTFLSPRVVSCLRVNLLTILTVVGVIFGLILGLILRAAKHHWTPRDVSYVKFIGDLFLNMLKALIVPLIVSTIIAAIGTLDLSLSSRIGGRGIAYYMGTTLLAIFLGIILAVIIQPGAHHKKAKPGGAMSTAEPTTTEDTLLDLVRTMFPPNIIQATLERYRTKLIPPPVAPNNTKPQKIDIRDYTMKGVWESGSNIMGLIVFSSALGLAITHLREKGKPFLDFIQSFTDLVMLLTTWVIWLSPIGAAFLITAQVLVVEDFDAVVKSLGLYFATVLVGLTIHGFIFQPILFFVITRTLPFRFMWNMMPAIMTAFGTSSSTATLPLTMKCLEEMNHVDSRVVRFLLPIGSTINMDGTALYEAVAAIFIAQMDGRHLGIGDLVSLSLTATAASIGAAGIPQAGLVTMVLVLNTVGLSEHYISYIVPIDWLLDRFRTVINVMGDSFVAGAISFTCHAELNRISAELQKSKGDVSAAGADDAEVSGVTEEPSKVPSEELGKAEVDPNLKPTE